MHRSQGCLITKSIMQRWCRFYFLWWWRVNFSSAASE